MVWPGGGMVKAVKAVLEHAAQGLRAESPRRIPFDKGTPRQLRRDR